MTLAKRAETLQQGGGLLEWKGGTFIVRRRRRRRRRRRLSSLCPIALAAAERSNNFIDLINCAGPSHPRPLPRRQNGTHKTCGLLTASITVLLNLPALPR